METAAEEEGAGGAIPRPVKSSTTLEASGHPHVKATMIDAGIPTKRTRADGRLSARAKRRVLILTLPRG